MVKVIVKSHVVEELVRYSITIQLRGATNLESGRNKRNVKLIMFRGEKKCVPAWAEELGFNQHTLQCRLNYPGWSIEEALTTPVGKKRSSKL